MWNKILNKLLLLLIPSILLSCSMDFNLRDGNQTVYKGSEHWMQEIDDDILIRNMTIPGTHDTCAQHDFFALSSTAAAQDLSLNELLYAGVRQVDIRLYYNGSYCEIHHGITYQYMSFDDVLNICYAFLEANPTETIIFVIKSEWKCEDSDICPSVEEAVTADSDKWITTTDATSLTLGTCRGKCVLVKRFSGLNSYGIPRGSGTGQLHQVDDACTSDLTTYWTNLYNDLEDQLGNSTEPFTIVWSSAYFEGQFGIPNIRMVSSSVNPKLEAYLDGSNTTGSSLAYTQCHLGMIGVDHITRRLAYKIYRTNFTNDTYDENSENYHN